MAKENLFLVDTSVLIKHLRQTKQPTVLELARKQFGTPTISEFTIFELEVGARRAGRKFEFAKNFSYMSTLPLTKDILIKSAELQSILISSNQQIGLPDTFIAATALYHDIPLFTLNEKDFRRVPKLKILQLSMP